MCILILYRLYSTYRLEVKVACIWNAHVTITKITTLKVASPSGYTQLSNTTVITLDKNT